jgi:hypothetical protein
MAQTVSQPAVYANGLNHNKKMVQVVSTFHKDDYFLTMKITFHDLQNNILNFDTPGLQSRQITSVHVQPHFC